MEKPHRGPASIGSEKSTHQSKLNSNSTKSNKHIKIVQQATCWNVLICNQVVASFLTRTQAVGFARRLMMPHSQFVKESM